MTEAVVPSANQSDAWYFPSFRSDDFGAKIKSYATLAASYLTDPICKVREYAWHLSIVDEMRPLASKTEKLAARLFLSAGIIACGALSIWTTVYGIALRYLLSYYQSTPYIHLKGEAPLIERSEAPQQLKVFFENFCCTAAGYAISDGGVAPWAYRINAIVKKIREQKADVICLAEIFDPTAAFYLYEKLKGEFGEFYFNMGIKPIGVGAGLFIASKYPVSDTTFVPYPVETLQGRTKGGCKGFFVFNLLRAAHLRNEAFARIYTTHLQHSEEPQFPHRNPQIVLNDTSIQEALKKDPEDDVIARAAQIEMIWQDINRVQFKGSLLLTGDLNLDDEEMKTLKVFEQFTKGEVINCGEKTWGGDAFCVSLVGHGKRASLPLNLDHTVALKGSVKSLKTVVVDAGFDGAQFNPHALSDHQGLLTTVEL